MTWAKAGTLLALVVAMLWPRPVVAMDVQQFARMAEEDQQDYITFLVAEAQKLLIQHGALDEAEKVKRLFRDTPEGGDRSLGVSQFASITASALHFEATAPPPFAGTITHAMASVLSQVLVNNGIRLPRNFTQALQRTAQNRVFYQKKR